VYDVPFILLVFLVVCFFIGLYIDNFLKLQLPVFTVLFTIIGIIGGIWSVLKRLSK